jgi:hypothetical protein
MKEDSGKIKGTARAYFLGNIPAHAWRNLIKSEINLTWWSMGWDLCKRKRYWRCT